MKMNLKTKYDVDSQSLAKGLHNIENGVSSLVFLADNYSVKTIREVLIIIAMDKAKKAEMEELFGVGPAAGIVALDSKRLNKEELDAIVVETINHASSMNLFTEKTGSNDLERPDDFTD